MRSGSASGANDCHAPVPRPASSSRAARRPARRTRRRAGRASSSSGSERYAPAVYSSKCRGRHASSSCSSRNSASSGVSASSVSCGSTRPPNEPQSPGFTMSGRSSRNCSRNRPSASTSSAVTLTKSYARITRRYERERANSSISGAMPGTAASGSASGANSAMPCPSPSVSASSCDVEVRREHVRRQARDVALADGPQLACQVVLEVTRAPPQLLPQLAQERPARRLARLQVPAEAAPQPCVRQPRPVVAMLHQHSSVLGDDQPDRDHFIVVRRAHACVTS